MGFVWGILPVLLPVPLGADSGLLGVAGLTPLADPRSPTRQVPLMLDFSVASGGIFSR